MLYRVAMMNGCRVLACDGEIGVAEDLLFDDERWVVRHLVVATTGSFGGRKVLISPYSIEAIEWGTRTVTLSTDRAKIEHSPDIDTDRPVSRQHESDYYQYYRYPVYWKSPTPWPGGTMPLMLPPHALDQVDFEAQARMPEIGDHRGDDAHLRSAREVTGYRVLAEDGNIGHVADFLFDEQTWAIRALVIDTRNWLPAKCVLIDSQRICEVIWTEETVRVDRSREQIQSALPFDPAHLPAPDTTL